jgi:hypothetical protein
VRHQRDDGSFVQRHHASSPGIGFRLAGGLELVDLKEVLLPAAIYAGMPSANTGFQIAAEEVECRSNPV